MNLGAISYHTIRQAKNLVKRMRSDSFVNIKKHWKLITIMIGSNDFCLDICYFDNQEKLLDEAERNMVTVLRILRDNLPRTLINMVIPVGEYKYVVGRLRPKSFLCEMLTQFSKKVQCQYFFLLFHFQTKALTWKN